MTTTPPRSRATLILLGAALVQGAVAFGSTLDPDETYYWVWTRHLAAGYFDHPPLVAVLMKIGVLLLGSNIVGVRIGALLANLGGAALTVAIARRHGGEAAARRAAWIVSAMPLLTAWLLLATPDPLTYCTIMAVLYCVDRALAEAPRSTASLRWWCVTGVMLGLALATKYLAIIPPIAVLFAFLSHKDLRRRLTEAGPYVAVVLSLVVFSPVVWWNATHQWASFAFQLHHGLGAPVRGTALSRVASFIGLQAGVITPLLWCLLLGVSLRHMGRRVAGWQHLFATTAIVTFAWFVLAALRQPPEANWPMMAYPAAAVVLATSTFGERHPRWFGSAVAFGVVLVAMMYAQVLLRWIPLAGDHDPMRRGLGWSEVAARVNVARESAGIGTLWVAGNRYQDASELAYRLPDHPEVFALNIQGRPNQYDMWPHFSERAAPGDRLIVLLDDVSEDGVAAQIGAHFHQMSPGERVAPSGDLRLLTPKRIWLFTGWDGSALPLR